MKKIVILNKYTSSRIIVEVGKVEYKDKNSCGDVLNMVMDSSLVDDEILLVKCPSKASLNAVENVLIECTDNYQIITIDDWVTCLDTGSPHGVDLNWAIAHIQGCT